MSPAVEARDLILEIVGPMKAGSQVQKMLVIAAELTGIDFRRIRSFWHTEARRINAEEMDTLRLAAQRAEKLRRAAEVKTNRRITREAKDRAEYRELKEELAAMQTRMADFAAQLARATADGAGAAPAREGSTHRPVA